MMTAVDPRRNGVAYAVTIQGTTVPETGSASGMCIVNKHIALFKFGRDDPTNPTSGAHWFPMPGVENIPRTADEWATDPWISVGGDGTVYLTFLRWRSFVSDPELSGETPCARGITSAQTSIELWVALPDPADPSRSLPLQPAVLDPSVASAYTPPSPTIVGTTSSADVPRLVASPSKPGLVFVIGAGNGTTFLVALQRAANPNAPDVFSEIARINPAASSSGQTDSSGQPVLAVDDAGSVYAMFLQDSTGSFPVVKRFRLSIAPGQPSSFQLMDSGHPPIGGTYAGTFNTSTPVFTPATGTDAVRLAAHAPTIAVARLGNSTDPVVYVAFDVFVDGGKAIELVATNGNDLSPSAWTAPRQVQASGGSSFMPAISVDGGSNVLDLMFFAFDAGAGTTISTFAVTRFFLRLDAGTLNLIAGPLALDNGLPMFLSDLPLRHGPVDNATAPIDGTQLFMGEYGG